MVIYRTAAIAIVTFLIVSIRPVPAQQKPTILPTDLETVTRYFDIVDNRMSGNGADFLIGEINKSQFVLLGEYHGSARIGELTRAIIPVFSAVGCRTVALEIGPVSGNILSRLSAKPAETAAMLGAYNSKYAVTRRDRNFTPIPFFDGVEDAAFLAEARKAGWTLIGLDQEGSFAYAALIDELYLNLDAKRRNESRPLYDRAITSVKAIYATAVAENMGHYKSILESKDMNDFMRFAEKSDPKNQAIVEAIKFTTEIFRMNDDDVRKYYEANSNRVAYMKRNLATGLRKRRFNPAKDKMLLKMGAVHTGRGFSPLSLFEIGNMVSELAAFNDNRSLHIEFGTRYFIENGKEIDGLADEKGFLYRYRTFLQMAKRDKWTVIDLRPLRKTVFYQRKFDLDPIILEIFKNQDLYVLPPTDQDTTPNYTIKR